MTYDMHDHTSVQDMTFVLAQDRIADLRASATATIDPTVRPAPAVLDAATTPPSLVTRVRDAVGRRLIELGGSVVADESIRQRALHL